MKFEDFFALMKEAEQIQTEASIKISEAIQSLNKITAPFYIQLLRGYADAISELYPGAEVVAKMLDKSCDKREIVVDVKDPHSGNCDGPK